MKIWQNSLIGAWLIVAGFSLRGETNIVIQTPRIQQSDYRSVYLRWNAETGAVYQIESADILGGVGPQGIQWIIRDSECVSKGNHAEWLDVGDPLWIPRILHPIQQPQRFYRVQKVNQTTNTPPNVSLQLSQTSPIAGDFIASVSVTLPDTNQSLNSISIYIDGQRLPRPAFPYTNYSTWINSSEWPNGQHEIYAVATISDSAQTTPADDAEADETNAVAYAFGVSSSQSATFSNFISRFFLAVPYFQAGQTQEVLATFEEDSYWRVKVVDYQDTEVRRYDGQGLSCYAAWDGNDQSGNPLPYGFYDYIIQARPSQYGPLSLASSYSVGLPGTNGLSADYRRTPAAMQFSRTNCNIYETTAIPSLNPTNMSGGGSGGGDPPPPPSSMTASGSESEAPPLFPSSPEEALENGFTYYLTACPPMPPVYINGEWLPWAEVFGPEPPLTNQISVSFQHRYYSGATEGSIASRGDMQPMANWPDATYETRTPTRIIGNLFFGFAGAIGVGYQGHHPSQKKVGTFGSAPGGVLASTPPWGPLFGASKIATGFSTDMGLAGWRTSFLYGDDGFNSTNLAPVLGAGSATGNYATKCNFGLFVGHITASLRTDPNYGSTVPYFPIYNSAQPGAYQWIPLPGTDMGNGNIFSKLRWMAFYGCQSLKQRDYSDLWTKFLLPMPPNLRLILGSEDGVYIDPRFGPLFADNMNGWTTQNNQPMAIFDAWADATGYAFAQEAKKLKHQIPLNGLGTRRVTAVYRDTTQGGSWDTLNDSIWNWGSDVSFDWFDVSLTVRQVYP